MAAHGLDGHYCNLHIIPEGATFMTFLPTELGTAKLPIDRRLPTQS